MSHALLMLTGHFKDLGGGFTVRRLLPAVQRKSVGPFLFFDHFGPVNVQPSDEYDVRPHPHIGLATVTYLFSGAILHRDNLGSVQQIEPGAINWMTAGRGIVHSERRPPALATQNYVNHGIQLWAALPLGQEDCPPSFTHTPASAIAELAVGDGTVRVLVGSAFGVTSPVATLSPTLYLDVQLPAGGVLELPALAQEMAVYAVDAGWPAAGRTHHGRVAARRIGTAAGGRHGGAADGDRRCAARCTPPYLVELCLQQQGAHRAGRPRLGSRPDGPGARRHRADSPASAPFQAVRRGCTRFYR